MTTKLPSESDGRHIEPGSPDDPGIFDTTDPYVEDKEGRGRRLVEGMPSPFRQLIEVYRTLDAQNRNDLAVLFVREHPKAGEPKTDEEIPPDFVDDLSDFDDNAPAWVRRQQDKYLGLIVCYLDSQGCDDWNIPSTSLVFAVEWQGGFDDPECAQWSVRLPGIMAESPNRSAGCKVLTEAGVVGLLGELRAVLGARRPRHGCQRESREGG
jgi:hypothetical protein